MSVTLQYLINTNKLSDLNIIAGKNGLCNSVSGCSILDYEFDKTINENKEFLPGQIVVTTFQYAKNNEILLFDAIKKLIDQKISALVIKNVYKLPFNDMLIRIADMKNLPVFIADNNTDFSDIIININEGIKSYENVRVFERKLDYILNSDITPEEAEKSFLEVFPNIDNSYMCICIDKDENLSIVDDNNIKHLKLYYKNNIFVVLSANSEYTADFIDSFSSVKSGISHIHNKLSEIKDALWESIYAYAMNNEGCTYFDSLGSYKIIFPFAKTKKMTDYCKSIISDVEYHDICYGSKLMETLEELINCNGSISAISKKLYQHENTIRHRLKKIQELTNLDFKTTEDYEQLSLAVKINKCIKLLEKI